MCEFDFLFLSKYDKVKQGQNSMPSILRGSNSMEMHGDFETVHCSPALFGLAI